MKSKQSGITLIGFLVVIAVVGFFGFMAMKLFPSYTEYMGVVKSMEQLSSDGVSGKSLDGIRRDLMRKMDFQYVDDAVVKPTDITIVRGARDGATAGSVTGTQLRVAYDKKIPFMYNIDFLLHFDKSVPLQGYTAQ
ncbi:MAG: DUF4845 domain-containing protein [Rhodanobacter sp.]